MKPEEFNAKLSEILTSLTDQAKVSTILTELTEDYNNVAVETTNAKATATKLTEDNEKLRQANMNLFLKVGEVKPKEIIKDKDTTPSFEGLFNAKGNLI